MQGSSERASFTYSQCLMRNTRIDFTQRFNVAACKVENCRMYFTSTTDLNSLIECSKSYVYTPILSFYASMTDTKEQKLIKRLL